MSRKLGRGREITRLSGRGALKENEDFWLDHEESVENSVYRVTLNVFPHHFQSANAKVLNMDDKIMAVAKKTKASLQLVGHIKCKCLTL